MNVDFLEEEFIDGCYSGVIRFLEDTDTGIHESVSFVYDHNLETISIINRLYPRFNAPALKEWSDYLVENREYIKHLIRENYVLFVNKSRK